VFGVRCSAVNVLSHPFRITCSWQAAAKPAGHFDGVLCANADRKSVGIICHMHRAYKLITNINFAPGQR